jgi:peptide/nickel transport system permease protein
MLPGVLAALRRTCASLTGATGFVVVALVAILAVFAPLIATHDPDKLDVLNRFAAPSAEHWLGTDHLGRDLFSRLVHGATVAMSVAVTAIAIALAIGTMLGILAAYLTARAERVVLILFDVISSFPSLVLALAIVAVFGPSTLIVIAIVAITLIPHFGRVARAQVLALKSAPFLEAERILGASGTRIVFSHILPNILGPLVVLSSMDIPVVITIEAGMSFLGLGVRPPTPSWGSILNDGFSFVRESQWPAVAGGLPIVLATLGFTFLGETLRDQFDPRLRKDA